MRHGEWEHGKNCCNLTQFVTEQHHKNNKRPPRASSTYRQYTPRGVYWPHNERCRCTTNNALDNFDQHVAAFPPFSQHHLQDPATTHYGLISELPNNKNARSEVHPVNSQTFQLRAVRNTGIHTIRPHTWITAGKRANGVERWVEVSQ